MIALAYWKLKKKKGLKKKKYL